MKKSAFIRLYGTVQGVGMRYCVYRKALSLGLCGYVRNMIDGSVEILAEGEERLIKLLIDYVNNGVRWARVEDMQIVWKDYQEKYKRFEIYG